MSDSPFAALPCIPCGERFRFQLTILPGVSSKT